jgi:manganese transport system permease protein
VVAMLITPGATAYLLTDRFDRMLALAVGTGVLSTLLGTYLSYHLDASTGGMIVVVLTSLFALAYVFGPRHGVLARR